MSAFAILIVISTACAVLGNDLRTTKYASDYTADQNYLEPVIAAGPAYADYGSNPGVAAISTRPATPAVTPIAATRHIGVTGSSEPLNNAAAVGAAQLSALQNAQAVHAIRIGNTAAAAIQDARVTEVAARAGRANAIQKAQALNAARITNLQRAEAAAYENARAIEEARRAASASALEAARAIEAARIANAARVRAVATANARYVEAARIANAVRTQAAAVASSAAHTQSVADTVANNVQDGVLLVGTSGLGGVAPFDNEINTRIVGHSRYSYVEGGEFH